MDERHAAALAAGTWTDPHDYCPSCHAAGLKRRHAKCHGATEDTAPTTTITADRSVAFSVRVSIGMTPALAKRFHTYLWRRLVQIEGEEELIRADQLTGGEPYPITGTQADQLAWMWARALDRQENPFADLYEVSGEDLFEDYGWFGQAIRPADDTGYCAWCEEAESPTYLAHEGHDPECPHVEHP